MAAGRKEDVYPYLAAIDLDGCFGSGERLAVLSGTAFVFVVRCPSVCAYTEEESVSVDDLRCGVPEV